MMNAGIVYLVVTMGVANYFVGHGYGGVSATLTPNMEICQQLASDIEAQLDETPRVDMDDVIIECKSYR